MRARRGPRWVLAGLALTLMVGAGPASAAPDGSAVTVIRFEDDPTGLKPNGWSSVDAPGVRFSDSKGAHLEVAWFGPQSHGRGLAVNPDDESYLVMEFDATMCGLTLAFGNDDPAVPANARGPAILELFLGSDRQLAVRVDPNWNDVMDQRISGDGVAFDLARFVYAVRSDRVPGLIEVVDDIGVRDC